MAQVKIAGADARPVAVLRGTIGLPRVGAWTGDLVVDSGTALTGRVTIVAPGITLVGTVARGGVYGGVCRVRVVGGADGLRKATTPKHYTSPVVRVVLQDLAETAGETIASDSDAEALNTTLLNWTTVQAPIGRILAALVETVPGLAWRVRADGALWVGLETWPDSTFADAVIVDEEPEGGAVVAGVSSPAVIPGTTFNGIRVDYVQHTITAQNIRTKVWAYEDGNTWDRVKGPLLAIAEPSPAPEYRGLYRVRLVSQSADLQKCGVAPDDPRVPPMENVPFAHGVPGLKVLVKPGAHLVVGWRNGSPLYPFAGLWDTDAAALKVVFEATTVIDGGETGAERAIKGDSYRAAEDSYLSAISKGTAAALGALTLIPEGIALAAADAAWAASAPGFLATNAKVK